MRAVAWRVVCGDYAMLVTGWFGAARGSAFGVAVGGHISKLRLALLATRICSHDGIT